MAEVALEHVAKVFANGVQAVGDLDLIVADGELVVLVGPSGSGKTTTLRLIAGLETPTHGAIRIGGRDVTALPPRQRDVAMVFQKHSLYPHLSVYDNLAFGLRLRRSRGWWTQLLRPAHAAKDRDIRQRVEETARLLKLEDVLERKPNQLSG